MDFSDLSISFTSNDTDSDTTLNSTRDIIKFYSNNNITLTALAATYALMGKNKSKYFVKKDIELHSKLTYNLYIKCDECKAYQCFDNSDGKKICNGCWSTLKPVETNLFVYIPVKPQIETAIRRNLENIVNYHNEIINKNAENIYDIQNGLVYKNLTREINENNNSIKEEIPFSIVLNIDGIQVFNIGSDSLWPIQLVLNGLPPKVRYLQENIIVAGIYY